MSNTTKLSVWMSSTSTVLVFISLTILNARRRQPVTASSFALTVTRPCSPVVCSLLLWQVARIIKLKLLTRAHLPRFTAACDFGTGCS